MLRVCCACIPAVLLSLLFLGESAVSQENSSFPVRYGVVTLQGDGQAVCPPTDLRDALKAGIEVDIRTLLNPPDRACGCGGVGWTRIAYLNMTDPTQQCPPAWNLITSPRSCGRTSSVCESTIYSVGGLQYSQVCGRINSYQFASPDAFNTGTSDIDASYVDGVSVTHGSPREHVWTFVGAYDESRTDDWICPCTNQ